MRTTNEQEEHESAVAAVAMALLREALSALQRWQVDAACRLVEAYVDLRGDA